MKLLVGMKLTKPNTSKLTKEQCQVRLEELIAQGYNPNHLRAVPDA